MNALTLAPIAPMPPLFRWRAPKTWLILFFGWNFPAFVALSYYYLNAVLAGQEFSPLYALTTTFSNWYLWMIMTPGAWMTAQRLPLDPPRNWPVWVGTHLFVMAILLAIQAMGNLAIFRILGLHDVMNFELWKVHLTLRAQINVLTYGLVVGLFYASDYYRRYHNREQQAAMLQVQLAQAQLMALKMQLQPHFLFNTMNAIASLVRQNESKRAITMLGKLADFLRVVLESKGEQEIPLSQEISFLQRYLDIELVRFNERLKVDLQIDAEAMQAYVPNLLLQPLVENTIKHGIAPHADAGKVSVRAKRKQDRLILEVADDGPGLTEAPKKQGVGLQNTQNRLRELYGPSGYVTFGRSDLGGLLVTIDMPYLQNPLLPQHLS
ncbi:MAG: histidine kinase [Rhodothermia bacterium]|nr:histidine kinase [Rhodothermia bacterium]